MTLLYDFEKYSVCDCLGGDTRIFSVALQEARIVAACRSADGILLANLAVVQPFPALLLLAQLRAN